MAVPTIPEGFHSITPYLVAKKASDAILFYTKAFNAKTMLVLNTPEGGIAHAELKIGNSHFMVTDEYPEMGFNSPETLGGSAVSMMLYVDDVDSLFANAIDAGAQELRPIMDQFYGDRAGTLKDPFGHVWTIGTHKEELTEEELVQRMEEYMRQSKD